MTYMISSYKDLNKMDIESHKTVSLFAQIYFFGKLHENSILFHQFFKYLMDSQYVYIQCRTLNS